MFRMENRAFFHCLTVTFKFIEIHNKEPPKLKLSLTWRWERIIYATRENKFQYWIRYSTSFWKLWLFLKLVVFESCFVSSVLIMARAAGRPALMLRSILFFNIDCSVLFKFPLRVMASFLPEIVLPYFGCKNSGMAIVYLTNLHSILQTVMESVKKQVDTTIAQLNKKSRANRWCREGTSKY